MSLLSELINIEGVIAAGEYSYRGDRFTYKGQLDEAQAQMASIMCRATSMSVHMQSDIFQSFAPDCGLSNARAWRVRGPGVTVCVVANVFCFLDNQKASLNKIVHLMQNRLADVQTDLI